MVSCVATLWWYKDVMVVHSLTESLWPAWLTGSAQISRPWRDAGNEGPHPQLPGKEGRSIRAVQTRIEMRPEKSRLLARVWVRAFDVPLFLSVSHDGAPFELQLLVASKTFVLLQRRREKVLSSVGQTSCSLLSFCGFSWWVKA